MIVATAGQVDHGKTTLVKALTGIDTDRLAEEKRRGMSIDLGFAHADLGAGAPISFVDVPGHERFIRNMAAGVAAVDERNRHAGAKVGVREAEIDRHAAPLLLGEPIGVDAGQRPDEGRLAMVDMAGGRDDHARR